MGVHGSQALQHNLERLRRSTADPALLIGSAKDLMVSVAKFVLKEHDLLPPKASFNQLRHLARERLGSSDTITQSRVDTVRTKQRMSVSQIL